MAHADAVGQKHHSYKECLEAVLFTVSQQQLGLAAAESSDA